MAAGFQVLQLKDHSADGAASAAKATPAGDEDITLTVGEEATAMEAFALLDVDNSGFIEQNEVDVLFGGLANRWLALFRLFFSGRWLFFESLFDLLSSLQQYCTAPHSGTYLTRYTTHPLGPCAGPC